jgi:hypothetical protein
VQTEESTRTNGRESQPFAAPSRPFVHAPGADELHAAISVVTGALAKAHELEQVLDLVRERAALRRELAAVDGHEREQRRERVA